MDNYTMVSTRRYVKSVGIKGDYPDEVLLELLIESHKSLKRTASQVNNAKKRLFGKQLLKYLGIE